MSDKIMAGLVTAVIITPLCAVCVLGPAALAAVFAGVGGWLGGLHPVVTTGVALVAGLVAFGVIRRRKARRPAATRIGAARR